MSPIARGGLAFLAAALIVSSGTRPAAGQDSTATRPFARPATISEAPPRAGASRPAWRWGGFEADLDVRPGYYASWSRERDGTSAETHDLRARARLGVRWTASSALTFRGRLAGRLSTDQDALRFYVRDHAPTGGLRKGEATVDELYIRWTPSERLDIRAGRMQTRFEMVGVARKSLDRNDSPSTDVTWTDGVHAAAALAGGWRPQLILQRNGSRGPTNVIRSPLDVTGSGSRVTIVAAVRNHEHAGPWVQRDVDLTYIPGAVPQVDGAGSAAAARRKGYLALVARAGIEPGMGLIGGRVVLAAAIGFAPTTPSRTLLGTGAVDDGDGDGLSYQLSANLMNAGGVHSFGVVHLRAGDGWLISPDVPHNSRDWEGRYYWQYAPWGRLDLRLRHRKELRPRLGAEERRRTYDLYVRTTLRFGPSRAPGTSSAAANGASSRRD